MIGVDSNPVKRRLSRGLVALACVSGLAAVTSPAHANVAPPDGGCSGVNVFYHIGPEYEVAANPGIRRDWYVKITNCTSSTIHRYVKRSLSSDSACHAIAPNTVWTWDDTQITKNFSTYFAYQGVGSC